MKIIKVRMDKKNEKCILLFILRTAKDTSGVIQR